MCKLPFPFHCVFVVHAALMCALGVAAAANDRIFKRIHSSDIAGSENFVSADRFKTGEPIGGRRLSVVGDNFAEHFLAVVERRVPAASVIASELSYTMSDTSIIKILGGGDAVITHLAHIYAMIEADAAGGSHTDWQSNIAFLRSPVDHRLWALHWSVNHAGEWLIGAVKVPHASLDWAAGTRVFSTLRTTTSSQSRLTIAKRLTNR
jgi:hypothetical protein